MKSTFTAELWDALQNVDRPGSFCVSGNAPLVLPGLDVTGVGLIGLPLLKSQAADLKSVCRQAPYGKGEKTLVDTGVRNVWQLDADRFQLTNPDWQAFLQETLSKVQTELGLEDQKLEAHLYNLLLYEKGSFFKSHRDGEKLGRMVATLVVELPSAYTGGELVVRHEGAEQVVRHGGDDQAFRLQFAAFYADCEHEIRPVRDGYRLCLVYNLTLTKSRSKNGISAPQHQEHVAEAARILSQWPADPSLNKIAVLLDHQYTSTGLAFDSLKGVDRARAKVLFEAAGQAACKAYLALVTYWQSGSAEPEYDDNRYRRRRRYRYGDDTDDENDASGGRHTMDEVYETSLSAENWSDAGGNAISFGTISIDKSQIVPQDSLTDVDPEEDYQGYTGNEGMTLERWYRHAAVVIWSEKRHFDVLCDAGLQASFAGLQKMVTDGKKAGKRRWLESRPLCLKFADKIIAHWPERTFAYAVLKDAPEVHALGVIAALAEASLIADFLRGPMVRDAALQSAGALRSIGKQHGWPTFQYELASIFEKTTSETLPRNVGILEEVCVVNDKNDDRRSLGRLLAGRLLTALETVDRTKAAYEWRQRDLDRTAILTSLVKSLMDVQGFDVLAQYVEHVLGHPQRYPLSDVQMPALINLESWMARRAAGSCPAIKKWLAACHDELHARVSNPPQKSGDWRRPATLSCKCELCRELGRFLIDPQEQVHRFSVRKDLRQHLHQIIDRAGCDLTHQTDRRGSPQTLVCTKTNASFDKAVKAHRIDVAHLARLVKIRKHLG